MSRISQFRSVTLVGVMLLFTFVSCGKRVESPVELVSKAELSIQQAESDNAREAAPLEMRVAKDKLDEAKQAMRNEDFKKAKYLAQHALAQAQLASAKEKAVTAKRNVDETMQNLDALRNEANE